MDDATTDVKTAEGDTATDSSTETKPSEGGQTTQPDQKPEPTVPYSRFKAVNEKLNEYKARESANTLKSSEGERSDSKKDESSSDTTDHTSVEFDVDKMAKQLKSKGFITREDQEVSDRVREAKSLVGKHDGKDGLPPFDIEEVTTFMKDKRMFGSYEDAYRLLHHDAIVAKEIEQAKKVSAGVSKPKEGDSAFTDAPTGEGEMSRQSIGKMTPEEWAKSGGAKGLRDKILSGSLKK